MLVQIEIKIKVRKLSNMEPSPSRCEFRRITLNSQTSSSHDPLRGTVRVSAFPGVEVASLMTVSHKD